MGNIGASTPPIVKNLVIINALMFLATAMFENLMMQSFTLYYPASSNFKIFQLFTHMFMHADFFHLLFNMYALWMFGSMIEKVWGGKKFLYYYLLTGFGAVGLHIFVQWLRIQSLEAVILTGPIWEVQQEINQIHQIYATRTLGASGAVFGILLAFGMLFPNTELQLIFPPIRLKAMWFVAIFGVLELFLGISRAGGGGIAHFAHVGGMLFGIILIRYWKHKGTLFRNDDYN